MSTRMTEMWKREALHVEVLDKLQNETFDLRERLRDMRPLSTKLTEVIDRAAELEEMSRKKRYPSASHMVHLQRSSAAVSSLSLTVASSSLQVSLAEQAVRAAAADLASDREVAACRSQLQQDQPSPAGQQGQEQQEKQEEDKHEAQAGDKVASGDGPPAPSYRLIHKSGDDTDPELPAAVRLGDNQNALASVMGCCPPWELTRMWPCIGKSLVMEAAKGYTRLTIDGTEKGGVQTLWERLPVDVAYRWGQRATNLQSVGVVYPYSSDWCAGTHTAIVESHAHGRAAAVGQGKGTLKTLTWKSEEGPQAQSSYQRERDARDKSTKPLPPTGSPVLLDALEDVRGLPNPSVRLNRNWQTPAIKHLDLHAGRDMGGAKKWVKGCEQLETFKGAPSVGDMVKLLKTLPKGRSLACLRSVGPLSLQGFSEDQLDELRQVLVERGCLRVLTELRIDYCMVTHLDMERKSLIEKLAHLTETVAHPDVQQQVHIIDALPSHTETRSIALELVEWSKSQSSLVQKLVKEFARLANVVTYGEEEDQSVAPAQSPSSLKDERAELEDSTLFPKVTNAHVVLAHGFRFNDKIVKAISKAPMCVHIDPLTRNVHIHLREPYGGGVVDDTARLACCFLVNLREQLVKDKNSMRPFTVNINMAPSAITGDDMQRDMMLWGSDNASLPLIHQLDMCFNEDGTRMEGRLHRAQPNYAVVCTLVVSRSAGWCLDGSLLRRPHREHDLTDRTARHAQVAAKFADGDIRRGVRTRFESRHAVLSIMRSAFKMGFERDALTFTCCT
ncbi:unnamed protein product [Vitrella brassicaformis CCMP3155]|uniref:Uncharacterized protein n=1 Tax=Vitrella brassicaformis (strain CCMP3155) TaxID=1169540 RepID=A0A0G4G0B3_VITBC|nr:unnamed protein product [Vitrella brassicaformis CCMP3155]|eukprot:CEM21296.1 unnamed protein product [Vitrella brassicaformis CCMP3155]